MEYVGKPKSGQSQLKESNADDADQNAGFSG